MTQAAQTTPGRGVVIDHLMRSVDAATAAGDRELCIYFVQCLYAEFDREPMVKQETEAL